MTCEPLWTLSHCGVRTILIGARGTGKTALMSCIREEALEAGWIAVSGTSLPGMLESATITALHAMRGIHGARQDMDDYILASTYRELSRGDLRFVESMVADPGESRLSVIASRMGVSNGYASKYKTRLLAAGVIGERTRGVVGLDIPGFREYVRTHGGAVTDWLLCRWCFLIDAR